MLKMKKRGKVCFGTNNEAPKPLGCRILNKRGLMKFIFQRQERMVVRGTEENVLAGKKTRSEERKLKVIHFRSGFGSGRNAWCVGG